MMRTFKTRHQFYLSEDLSAELERLSSRAGASKTAVLSEAFRLLLEKRSGPDVDRQFGQRLEKLSRGQERIDKRIDILAEALGTFIQHQLTLVAHQPPFDEDARSLGLERYRTFVDLVGRRMARTDSPLRLAPREEKNDD